MIFARKINKIPEFYMILKNARILQLPEKYFSRFFLVGGGHVPLPLPPSPTPMLLTMNL